MNYAELRCISHRLQFLLFVFQMYEFVLNYFLYGFVDKEF